MQSDEHEVVNKISPRSVTDTVARLRELLASNGLKLFTVIDQQEEARQVGMDLRETTLVVFGSPAAGTAVMESRPQSALDLPLKVLVWDDGGRTKVSYLSPSAIARRYDLPSELGNRLAGIDPITDALVAD